jgi:hypothetical protein
MLLNPAALTLNHTLIPTNASDDDFFTAFKSQVPN